MRAALPVIGDAGEHSVYDTFLQLQGASQLLRLGRTAEAAAALPGRVPSDAISSTATFYAALRARWRWCAASTTRCARGSTRCAGSWRATGIPQWVEVLETMAAELAAVRGPARRCARRSGARHSR